MVSDKTITYYYLIGLHIKDEILILWYSITFMELENLQVRKYYSLPFLHTSFANTKL